MKIAGRFFHSLGFVFVLVLSSSRVDAATASQEPVTPMNSVIEKIAFEGISMLGPSVVLERIGVKAGQVMTPARAQEIGRRLRTLPIAHTFSYKKGSRPGLIIVSIGMGC